MIGLLVVLQGLRVFSLRLTQTGQRRPRARVTWIHVNRFGKIPAGGVFFAKFFVQASQFDARFRQLWDCGPPIVPAA